MIATVQYHRCAAPDYLATRTQDEWEIIGYGESLAKTPQQEWLTALAANRPFVLTSNDLNSIASATRAGAGVWVLPDYLAAGLALSDINCPVQRKLWMLIHDDVRS